MGFKERVWVWVVASALVTQTACSSTTVKVASCAPGERVSCETDSCTGSKTCNSDGHGYSACVCGSGGAGGGTSAGGSAGKGGASTTGGNGGGSTAGGNGGGSTAGGNGGGSTAGGSGVGGAGGNGVGGAAGSRASGGMGGSAGVGGTAGGAGGMSQGGVGGADPCSGVTCRTPPSNVCANSTQLREYGATGTCNAGTCTYPSSQTSCTAGCAAGACVTDVWLDLSTVNAPASRLNHTAVWTGTEMIVWGGMVGAPAQYLDTGARYSSARVDPDQWIPLANTLAPTARGLHTAVWTGTEMIVWGGTGATGTLNTGGIYSVSGGWSGMSTANAPSAREGHTAVWTGTEMIVWGGDDGSNTLNTGGRYDPATNSWTPMTVLNAPNARTGHTAVWTGTEMIVWGGSSTIGRATIAPVPLNTGARYNPATDSWTPVTTTNAPSARRRHTAVWTGTEMIVWGGDASTVALSVTRLGTGARYDPAGNAWTTMATTNAPGDRYGHTALWTGSEMIVWGGDEASGNTNAGARYDPTSDTWNPMSGLNAPLGRTAHSAVWADSQMIVFGGATTGPGSNSGGRYVP